MNKRKRFRSLTIKIVRIVVVLCVILAVAMCVASYFSYKNRMEEKYKDEAFSVAKIVADYIDADKAAGYAVELQEEGYDKESIKDDYYEEILDYLLMVKVNSGVKYLYVVVPEEEGYRYIWDAGDPDVNEGVCDLGDFDEYYQGGKKVMRGAFFGSGKNNEFLITDNSEYGAVASAFVTAHDSAGNPAVLVCVDISMEQIKSDIYLFNLLIVTFIIVIMVLFSWSMYLYLTRTIVFPVKKLDGIVEHFVEEQMKNEEELVTGINTGDEIENLAESFSSMATELRTYMINFEKAVKEKERIGTELNVATKIQADMLPSEFPAFPDRKDFDIFASMTPAKEVGGDFYDFFMIDDDHIALVMADVSGKGVPAALFMVISKTLIKTRTLAGGTPGEILYDVNNQLCEGNEAGLFVTVWLAIVEISTGKVVSVNAGHEHPAIKHRDGSFELDIYKHGMPLAAMEGVKFKEREFEMGRGDILFVYTDGVPEATDSRNELYGAERMVETLNSLKDEDVSAILKGIKNSVDEFVGEAEQFDDLTMLAFKLSD